MRGREKNQGRLPGVWVWLTYYKDKHLWSPMAPNTHWPSGSNGCEPGQYWSCSQVQSSPIGKERFGAVRTVTHRDGDIIFFSTSDLMRIGLSAPTLSLIVFCNKLYLCCSFLLLFLCCFC